MSTLLILTLAGSIMTLLCFAFSRTVGCSARTTRIWLTVAALLYLIPLGGLKSYYTDVLDGADRQKWYSEGVQWDESVDFLEVQSQEAAYQSTALKLNTLVYLVWVAVAAAFLICSLVRYCRRRSVILRNCEPEEDDGQLAELDRLRREARIHRRVRILNCHDVSPISMGVFRPVIILPRRMRGNVPVTLLRHELAHIRNLDVPMNLVLTMVKAIHWFNPAAYLLKKEFAKVCEILCDDEAVRGLGPSGNFEYAELLVSELRHSIPDSAWVHSLSKDTKEVQERIMNIMNRRKLGRIRKCIGAVALTVSLFACSLTALAYEDVQKLNADEEALVTSVSMRTADEVNVFEGEVLLSESVPDESDTVAILYEEQFIDEDGNIYEVNTEVQPYRSCDHELKSGTMTRHIPFADGHCEVEYYRADWCVYCGEVWAHELVKIVTYPTCPHK